MIGRVCLCHFVVLSLLFCLCHFVFVVLSLSFCLCSFVFVVLSLLFCLCCFVFLFCLCCFVFVVLSFYFVCHFCGTIPLSFNKSLGYCEAEGDLSNIFSCETIKNRDICQIHILHDLSLSTSSMHLDIRWLICPNISFQAEVPLQLGTNIRHILQTTNTNRQQSSKKTHLFTMEPSCAEKLVKKTAQPSNYRFENSGVPVVSALWFFRHESLLNGRCTAKCS